MLDLVAEARDAALVVDMDHDDLESSRLDELERGSSALPFAGVPSMAISTTQPVGRARRGVDDEHGLVGPRGDGERQVPGAPAHGVGVGADHECDDVGAGRWHDLLQRLAFEQAEIDAGALPPRP